MRTVPEWADSHEILERGEPVEWIRRQPNPVYTWPLQRVQTIRGSFGSHVAFYPRNGGLLRNDIYS